MKPFEYAQAQSYPGAVELYREARSSDYLGGGVDLLGQLKDSLVAPDRLVNLKRIPDSATIKQENGAWNFGPTVTISRLQEHPEINKRFPAIAEASRHVGSPQIRNMGTLGGNLAQHSRCWYYRHKDIQCLKNGGELCYASIGESRYHCLFTGNPCISPAVSNLATAVMALDGRVFVLTDEGEQEWTIERLFEEAWNNPTSHHSLKPGNLIVRVVVPDEGRRSHYLQQSEKAEFDWALVSVAASAKIKDGVLRDPRLVLGCVAPGPYQVAEVNALLEGKRLTEDLAAKAAEKLLEGAEPTPDNAYKLPLAKTLARRCLMQLVG